MSKKNTPASKQKTPEKESAPVSGFLIGKHNYKLVLIGLAVIVLGFILMAGGGSDDPNVFTGKELFSFRRITLAPVLVILGFAFEVYAIMKKPKNND